MGYLLALMLIAANTLAFDITITRMKRESGMSQSFDLTTNHANPVTLDCQSFIQGLYLGPRETTDIIMLDAWECEELHRRIDSSLRDRKRHCLDVEDVIRSDYRC